MPEDINDLDFLTRDSDTGKVKFVESKIPTVAIMNASTYLIECANTIEMPSRTMFGGFLMSLVGGALEMGISEEELITVVKDYYAKLKELKAQFDNDMNAS